MFKSAHRKRSTSLPFVIFRLLLSLTIFFFLLGGAYSAYKHFSGMDPLKLDPQAIFTDVLATRDLKQIGEKLAAMGIIKGAAQKVIPQDSFGKVGSNQSSDSGPKSNSPVAFKFLLVADSHSENEYLQRAVTQAKKNNSDIKFIIGLGDYSEVGTVKELTEAKAVFDAAGIRYFLLIGDHDMWDSRNRQLDPSSDFREVFGLTYQSFNYNGVWFLLMNNADNYNGLGLDQSTWVTDQLDKIKNDKDTKLSFAFVHTPLYHPSSDHYMGKVEKNLTKEARNLVGDLKAAGIKEVFAGDIHYFTRYSDAETGLKMTTVGAVASQRNTQAPRYSIVTVHQDNNYDVDDIEIK